MGVDLDNKNGNISATNGLKIEGQAFPTSTGTVGQILQTTAPNITEWKSLNTAGMIFVSTTGSDAGDGSVTSPYKTISKAVSIAPPASVIMVLPGTYVEDISITTNDISITGTDRTKLFGSIRTSGTGTKLNNISIDNNTSQTLIIDGAGFSATNCGFRRFSSTNTAIIIQGVHGDYGSFQNCTTTGTINISTSGAARFNIHGCILSGSLNVGGNVHVANSIINDAISHQSGSCHLVNSSISSDIVSTASDGDLLVSNLLTMDTTGTKAKLNKTGTCPYTIINTSFDDSSIYTGTTHTTGISSDNITVSKSVINYSPIDTSSLTAHLQAIDAALAPKPEATLSVTNVTFVSQFGSNANDGSLTKPVRTITKALSLNQTGTIVLLPGSFSEDVVVSTEATIMSLCGGVSVNTMTISASSKITNIGIGQVTINAPSVIISDCTIGDVVIASTSSTTISSTTTTNVINKSNGDVTITTSSVGTIRTQSEFSRTHITNCPVISHVDHQNGILVLRDIGRIAKDSTGVSILSTADLPISGKNFLVMDHVGFTQDDMTIGIIRKQGNCGYILSDCDNTETFDMLCGQRTITRNGNSISAGYAPSNYDPVASDISSHLAAIDAVLENIGASGTPIDSVLYVSKNGTFEGPGTSPNHSFNTISAAMMAVSRPTVIEVAPGYYDDSIILKPNVKIRGASPSLTSVGAIQFTLGDSSGTIDIENITAISLSVNHNSPNGGSVNATVSNCIFGEMAFTGSGAGRDALTIRDTKITGDFSASGVDCVLTDSIVAATTHVQDHGTYASASGHFTIMSVSGSSLSVIDAASGYIKSNANIILAGSLSGSTEFVHTASGAIGTLSQSGSSVVRLLDDSAKVAYKPSVSGDWGFATQLPSSVASALDQISKTLSSVGGTSPASIAYVATNGNDNNIGSISKPYATVSKAVASVSAGTAIIVFPGQYNENITINRSGISIIAMGNTTFNGRFLLLGTSANSGYFENIRFINTGALAVSINGATDTTFTNCKVSRTDQNQIAMKIEGTAGGKIAFVDGDIDSGVDIIGDQSVNIRGINNKNARIRTAKENATVVIEDCALIGQVIHDAGLLTLRNIGRIEAISNISIQSTSGVGTSNGNKLVLDNINLIQADNTYGKINKTGTCPFTIIDVARDSTTDIITGNRTGFGRITDDIKGNHTATNYTPNDNSLRGHLAGIDGKLAIISAATGTVSYPTKLFVSSSGNDSNNGGPSDPFKTIQKALSVVAAKPSTQNTPWVIDVIPGIYSEEISLPASKSITITSSGKWVLGDGYVPTNKCNVIINTDGTALSTSPEPAIRLENVTISGDIGIVGSESSSPLNVTIQNVDVVGKVYTLQTSDVTLTAIGSSVRSSIEAISCAMNAYNCQFGDITIKRIDRASDTTIHNVTLVEIGSGILTNCNISGLFNGPAHSFRADGTTIDWFHKNGGMLSGTASYTLVDVIPGTNEIDAGYNPSNYLPQNGTLRAHLSAIDASLTAQTIKTSYTPTVYMNEDQSITSHLAAIDASLNAQVIKSNRTSINYASSSTITSHLTGIDTAIGAISNKVDLINNKSSGSAVANLLYVSFNANASIADGTPSAPFGSIKAALDAISSASATNQYNIIVGPGRYFETTGLVLKPNVNIIGSGRDATTIMMIGDAAFQLPLSDTTTGSTTFSDMYIGSVLSVARNGITTSEYTIYVRDCKISSDMTFDGGTGDKLRITNLHAINNQVTVAVAGDVRLMNIDVYAVDILNNTDTSVVIGNSNIEEIITTGSGTSAVEVDVYSSYITDINVSYGSFNGDSTLLRANITTTDPATVVCYATPPAGSVGISEIEPGLLASVATTGSYTDLSNRPTFAPVAQTGNYIDLTNRPVLSAIAISGKYSDLTGSPVLASVATSGNYGDLLGSPVLSVVATSGKYSDLTDSPVLASVATSGNYGDLNGIPTPIMGNGSPGTTTALYIGQEYFDQTAKTWWKSTGTTTWKQITA